MKTKRIQKPLFLILSVLALGACQKQQQFRSNDASNVLSSISPAYDPVSYEGELQIDHLDEPVFEADEESDDFVYSIYRKHCGDFFSSINGIDLSAQDDLILNASSGNNKYFEPIRNLTLKNSSGNITIASAITANVINQSGSINLNAQSISKIEGISGNICLSARDIGSIKNGSGNTHVFAESIESVTVQSGNFHIYGATIKVANGLSGNICLHDGAKILSLGNFSGNIDTSCK